MVKSIKSLLLKVLGQEKYLQLTSSVFFLFFNNGWLRKNPSYYTHYLVARFIKRGDTIIDIGANLGYYSRMFADRTGQDGQVFSVEPIEMYRRVLVKNISAYRQVKVIPFALGKEEGTLKMGNPSADKHRHGLMRVIDKPIEGDVVYEVEVKNPANLFKDLESIDYIKCDIEGYEVPVIPAMRPLIEKHRPILQVETEGENKMLLMGFFKALNYKTFYAGKDALIAYENGNYPLPGDLIAIPSEKCKD